MKTMLGGGLPAKAAAARARAAKQGRESCIGAVVVGGGSRFTS
jgi:hypothetical protein